MAEAKASGEAVSERLFAKLNAAAFKDRATGDAQDIVILIVALSSKQKR
ncbi:MAG: hypothetical protein WA476_14890 [Acidobacteriaceae bacterium]